MGGWYGDKEEQGTGCYGDGRRRVVERAETYLLKADDHMM